ncbi:MAG: helix-turn-helix domain-containing protein [Spirochaetia bacterium]|nr:helix-turn-helix domain-containing protein [Spirochaetia bacterium]
MEKRVYMADHDQVLAIAKALSSPLRLRIVQLLLNNRMNIHQIADELGILQSTCTVNIQALEQAGIVSTELIPAARGNQKVCYTSFEEIILPLSKEQQVEDEHVMIIDMPIGLYTNFSIHPPCGIVSKSAIIDYLDSERAFLSPQRSSAELIWFTHGFLEYSFPVTIPSGRSVKSLQISAELCSEFPGCNNEYPSDITVWINGCEIGTWTSPGDMGGTKGRFTPQWWGVENTQYGFLKSWRVTAEQSFIDGVAAEGTTIDDLHLGDDYRITVKFGIREDAYCQGGLNLFGESFGNYATGIKLQIELNPR